MSKSSRHVLYTQSIFKFLQTSTKNDKNVKIALSTLYEERIQSQEFTKYVSQGPMKYAHIVRVEYSRKREATISINYFKSDSCMVYKILWVRLVVRSSSFSLEVSYSCMFQVINSVHEKHR